MLLMFLSACGPGSIRGAYKAEEWGVGKAGGDHPGAKRNGDGLWRVGTNEVFSEVSFAWYIRRGELRMNTKGGECLWGG